MEGKDKTTSTRMWLGVRPATGLAITDQLSGPRLIDKVEVYEGDAGNMPFEDNLFDAVYMASSLELFDTPDIGVHAG